MAQNQVTEVAVEVLNDGAASVRTTEVAAEVLHAGGTTSIRATEIAVEVLRTVADASIPGSASGDLVSASASLPDGHAFGSTMSVSSDVFTPAQGSLVTATVSVIGGEATERREEPLDGTSILEFEFNQTPNGMYGEADYFSIFSCGDRIANGLINVGQYGVLGSFGSASEMFDGDYARVFGNGFTPYLHSTHGGIWFEFGPFQVSIRGITFRGKDHITANVDTYGLFGGTSQGNIWPTSYAVEFDAFTPLQVTDDSAGPTQTYWSEYAVTPRDQLYWSHYEIILTPSPTDASQERIGNEIELKISHSSLDGGDRRTTNGRPDKRTAFTMSSHFAAHISSGFIDPANALFDGSISLQDLTVTTAAIGAASNTTNPVTTAGAWLQFAFPREVTPQIMLWQVRDKETYTGSNPDTYGVWHWEYSVDGGTNWLVAGGSWSFRENCNYMTAPRNPRDTFGLTASAAHWRMVLDSGSAFGDSHWLSEVQFQLIDPGGQVNFLSAAFSDGDSDALQATLSNIGASPYSLAFSDGSDDALQATLDVLPNLILSGTFSDDEPELDATGDFYASTVSQVVLVQTGRS